MKKASLFSLLYFLTIVLMMQGCNKLNPTSQSSNPASTPIESPSIKNSNTTDANIELSISIKAQLVDGILLPDDAKIISDEKNTKQTPSIWKRAVKAESKLEVPDLYKFYRKELFEREWKPAVGEEDESESGSSFLAMMRFSKGNEEMSVDMLDKDKTEIEISVYEAVPLPSNISGIGRSTSKDSRTIDTGCPESIGSVVEFYKKEMVASGWTLKGEKGNAESDKPMILTFNKNKERAVVTLTKSKDKSSTNIEIQIRS